jgi:hypothetical protein
LLALIATAPLRVPETEPAQFEEPGERVGDAVQNMPATLVLIEEVPTTSEPASPCSRQAQAHW